MQSIDINDQDFKYYLSLQLTHLSEGRILLTYVHL